MDPPSDGAGAARCWSRFCDVALSVPLIVIVELACTMLKPACVPPGPCAESSPCDVTFTAHPVRKIVPPNWLPSAWSERTP